MMNKTQSFDIIRFTADKKRYYPASLGFQNWMDENIHTPHTAINIPLGQSRYGGPIVDLPETIQYPDTFYFAAQLDLTKFSPFDTSELLPKSGHLFFFVNVIEDAIKVMYADVKNEQLVRTIREHDKMFFEGVLIGDIYAESENFEERFRDIEFEDEKEYADEDGKIWDDRAGSEKSKLFGIYTNCQYEQEDIEDVMSDNIVLLQIGETDFNDEGVFTVLIKEEDLKNQCFDKCTFTWAQT